MSLTIKRIARASQPGRYSDGRNLYLQVNANGAKSWLFRYELNGQERAMGLGPTADFTLKEARERANKARQLLADGIDPLEHKRSERAAKALEAARALIFKEAATQYFNQHESKWKNSKHRAQFLSTLEQYVFPKIGKLSVAAIDTGLVLKCLEPIWADKTETASRVRGRIESVLDWATVRGYRSGDNPARWKGHLDQVLPARAQIQQTNHHAALPYAELPAFMVELAKREGTAARALEFTILTAARTGEVIGATWPEINLPEKVWTVPANRIKGGREHRVPLSDRAIALLKALPQEEGNDHIFIAPTATSPLSNMAMNVLLRRMKRDDITVHGFRSTFRDWAAEQTSYPNHVVEMALAHVIGDKVEAAYRRGDLFDKRKKLMAEWAGFAKSPPNPQANNVLPIRGARR
jgi:integrase